MRYRLMVILAAGLIAAPVFGVISPSHIAGATNSQQTAPVITLTTDRVPLTAPVVPSGTKVKLTAASSGLEIILRSGHAVRYAPA